jgi:uncharacterized protein
MENNIDMFKASAAEQTGSASKTFMANVFSWMFAALMITAVFAWYFASSGMYKSMISPTGHGLSGIGYLVMLSPLGFVLLMSFGFQRLSYPALIAVFLIYAGVVGISFSLILLAYTMSSIFLTFAITAGTFGVMAIMGYNTKQDLTGFGAVMRMGLIGIVIASLVNMFMGSDTLDYIISFIGVLVFTGLTAYDVQKLKRIGEGAEYGAEPTAKLAILGALTLYLDFINLFLMLLRFFGRRD